MPSGTIYRADGTSRGWFESNNQADLQAQVGTDERLVMDTAPKLLAAVAPAALPESDAQALTRMLATVDSERETQQMAYMTQGVAKKYAYAQKVREYKEYSQLSVTLLTNLLLPVNLASTRQRFSWAFAEMDETGDSLQTVMTRWGSGINNSGMAEKIEARAGKLKRQIRAASPANRKAIFDARKWPDQTI